MDSPPGSSFDEWLETDGLGGYAMGTVCGVRTRRYHALLTVATKPPTGRVVLVNGFEAWIEDAHGRHALSSHRYAPDEIYPDGRERIVHFAREPWPAWRFRIEGGAEVVFELFICHGAPRVVLGWRIEGGNSRMVLRVRPLLTGRDHHALHIENNQFRFDADCRNDAVRWRPYDSVPRIAAYTNGVYRHDPLWFRDTMYADEQARGFPCVEDLASPGEFSFDLHRDPAMLVFEAETVHEPERRKAERPPVAADTLAPQERGRRERFGGPLLRAADAYLVKRGQGMSVIAGYPWFADWGRDTFIAMRGLCLATGRLDVAGAILLEWAGRVSEGMLPNAFPDGDALEEYNSVDAPLWFIVAAHEYLALRGAGADPEETAALGGAMLAILEGYTRGTRHRIHADHDALLAAGDPGVQLTWMDAKIGDWVVTPRTGKPVEIQALWINALRIGTGFDGRWKDLARRASESFLARFWNEDRVCLFDVVDVGHVHGKNDGTMRPNQIFAVGGLPFAVVGGRSARAIVDRVEAELLTPMGLRTLGRNEPGYAPRYEGGPLERDAAYHQGTAWPWLMGAFVDAWLKVHAGEPGARDEAGRRFLEPLLAHVETAGLGHVSEIADAEPPHTPHGCPFQAWSLGELIRIQRMLEFPERE